MRVTDFAQVVKDENSLSQVDSLLAGGLSLADVSAKPCTVYDWESPKLSRILSINFCIASRFAILISPIRILFVHIFRLF